VAHELRYIAFDRGEVADLLRRFGATRGIAVPPGRVEDIAKAGAHVFFKYVHPVAGTEMLMVKEADAVACLILGCADRRLPLARHFVKSVEATDNALVLALSGRALPASALASAFTAPFGSPRTRR
jgi:hypothetical protein